MLQVIFFLVRIQVILRKLLQDQDVAMHVLAAQVTKVITLAIAVCVQVRVEVDRVQKQRVLVAADALVDVKADVARFAILSFRRRYYNNREEKETL